MAYKRYKPIYTRMLRGDVDRAAQAAAQAGMRKSVWLRDVVAAAIHALGGEVIDWDAWAPIRGHRGDVGDDKIVVVAVGLLRDDFDRLGAISLGLGGVAWWTPDGSELHHGITKSTWARRAILLAVKKNLAPGRMCLCGHHAGQHDTEGCTVCRCWKYRQK